jgi:hypothetical protein
LSRAASSRALLPVAVPPALQAAGVVARLRAESHEHAGNALDGDAHARRGKGRRRGVGDVVARAAGERDRHRRDLAEVVPYTSDRQP